MMIQINPKHMIPKWVTYILQDANGRDLMIYYCKFIDLLKLHDVVKNPLTDIEQTYNLYIMGYYDTMREAQNAQGLIVRERGMPPLLLTHHANALGSIQCNETGQVWARQSDCVREIGCDSSALSRHLKRAPGFATIKGMTYSRNKMFGFDGNGCANLNPKAMHQPRKPRWIQCNETKQIFKTQREACKLHGINQGQLSQHLQHHAGYKTVKGLTFSYIEGDKPHGVQPVHYPVTRNQ